MLYTFINLCTREQILFVASRKLIFTVALEKDNPMRTSPKMHALSKYTVPTTVVGMLVVSALPTKIVGMLVVSALPTKVVGMLVVSALPTKIVGMLMVSDLPTKASKQINPSKRS